jgi:hypothetical protein
MTKLIKVKSINTEHIVYVDGDKFDRIKGTSSTIWGQVSEIDESGWFFFADDLEVID